jgi:translation initiation factor 2 subunit 1
MLYKKKGFPEDDELVLCTVSSVQHNSVFAKLDEYDRDGMIHISEIAPGRIRNIRDYVVEGKKVVCKVLRTNQERGYIDLSLRRVNEMQKRTKLEFIKQEQRAEKILEVVSKKLNLDIKKLYEEIKNLVSKDYDVLHTFFEDVALGNAKLADYNIDKKIEKDLFETIALRIKKPEVELKGEFTLQSLAPDGVEVIKSALAKAQESNEVDIRYRGSGKYALKIISTDFKKAEKILEKSTDAIIKHIEKLKGKAIFTRLQ